MWPAHLSTKIKVMYVKLYKFIIVFPNIITSFSEFNEQFIVTIN